MANSKDINLAEMNADRLLGDGQDLSVEELAAIERWKAMANTEALDDEALEEIVLSHPEHPEKISKVKKPRKVKFAQALQGATAIDEAPELFGLADSPDNGMGDEFTELAVEAAELDALDPDVASMAEHNEAEAAPGLNRLMLTSSNGGDVLSMQAETSDDRHGLMLWDEAINLEAQVEAIIFAAPKPISVGEIAELLADDDGNEPSHVLIDTHIQLLQRLYKERSGGFRLEYDKGSGYQFRTITAAAPLMERMFSSRQRPLSRAAHETLAIIAYRQPCTRADIEFIRGVDAGSIIKNLLERDLIVCVGRKEDSGRPMLFGTTSEFLRVFRIQTLNDLAPLSAFQPTTESMILAFQKIESPEDSIDVEEFIGDADREPFDTTQFHLTDLAASGSRIDVREDASETAPHSAQIRRVGGYYDNEGYSRDDGFEDTEVVVGSRDSIAPGSRENASRRPDRDQRQSGERTRDKD